MAARKRARKVKATPRADSWANLYSGLGVSGIDPGANAQFYEAPRLTPEEGMRLYRGEDLAARLCDAKPTDGMRRTVRLIGTDPATTERLTEVVTILDRHRVHAKMRAAAVYGQATGGAGCLLLVNDGKALDEELDATQGHELVSVVGDLDARCMFPETTDMDPASAHYGDPLTYRIWLDGAGISATGAAPSAKRQARAANGQNVRGTVIVHRSRLVLFGGALTSRIDRQQNNGWDDSILRKAAPILRQIGVMWGSLPVKMQNTAQAKYGLKNLKQILSAGGEAELQRRLRLLQLGRAMGIVPYEFGEEDFSFATGESGSGFVDMLNEGYKRLASVADGMPLERLIGEPPGGLNATGASGERGWYDKVASWQELELKPLVRQVVTVILGGSVEPDAWSVEFAPLWQQTPLEEAQTYFTVMQADNLAIENKMVDAGECVRGHFGKTGFSILPEVDPAKIDPASVAKAKREAQEAAAAGAEKDPQAALNGAQVSSMIEVIGQVATGAIPRETGVQILVTAFPLDLPAAERLMGEVGRGFVPTKPEPEPPPFGGPKPPFPPPDKPEPDPEDVAMLERLRKRRAA